MCRKCDADWDDRKYYAMIVVKQLGEKAGEFWLWNETPFPVALPSWDQIAQALRAPYD